jgi:hypothetical protein
LIDLVLIDLALSARRPSFDKAFEHVPDDVFKSVAHRSGGACQGCGFFSPTSADILGRGGGQAFLEIHHLDGNRADSKPDNLAALCRFCHAVFHCGEDTDASIIFCPWLTQAQINRVANVCLHWANAADPEESGSVWQARKFMSGMAGMAGPGRSMADRLFSPGASNPAVLGRVLANMAVQRPKEYGRRSLLLAGLRLLPLLPGHGADGFEAIEMDAGIY